MANKANSIHMLLQKQIMSKSWPKLVEDRPNNCNFLIKQKKTSKIDPRKG